MALRGLNPTSGMGWAAGSPKEVRWRVWFQTKPSTKKVLCLGGGDAQQ